MPDEPVRPSQSLPAGQRLRFEVRSEPSGVVLTLEDGAELHVHPIVVDVIRHSQTDERGEPIYSIAGGLAVRVMKAPSQGVT